MKVLLAMPTMWSVPTSMVRFLYYMAIPAGVELTLKMTDRLHIMAARNELIATAISHNYDYIWFLDDDNPPEDYNVLKMLLEADKDIVSGLVPSRLPDGDGKHRLCVFDGREEIDGQYTYKQMMNVPKTNDLFPIVNCGFGCALIKVEALKCIRDKYYGMPCEMKFMKYYQVGTELIAEEAIDPREIKDGMVWAGCYVSEDVLCIERLRREGYEVRCDPRVKCKHIGMAGMISIEEHILCNNQESCTDKE